MSTNFPTSAPTFNPSMIPTVSPSGIPTSTHTAEPTVIPTKLPTMPPTVATNVISRVSTKTLNSVFYTATGTIHVIKFELIANNHSNWTDYSNVDVRLNYGNARVLEDSTSSNNDGIIDGMIIKVVYHLYLVIIHLKIILIVIVYFILMVVI